MLGYIQQASGSLVEDWSSESNSALSASSIALSSIKSAMVVIIGPVRDSRNKAVFILALVSALFPLSGCHFLEDADTSLRPPRPKEVAGESDSISLPQQAQAYPPMPEGIAGNILGRWEDRRSPPEYHHQIFLLSSGDNVVMTKVFKDGSKKSYPLREMPHPMGRRLEDRPGNSFGEYFVFTPSGDFQYWSGSRLYYTAPKVPFPAAKADDKEIEKIRNEIKAKVRSVSER